ncbi:Threonine/homoserine/homoserine lactone efflux protein [Thermomonospora echinospora]|uniref:Threonine/homoserine/homoserine lactone efflux protein n=1 Tax=Thermomonospora echinospora TaxID=1992 RepID=A0A1H6DJI2_9ACTN|nr:Threonine/homoserine/homoserine lactone efflux protein [Thermomonospora echinospora]
MAFCGAALLISMAPGPSTVVIMRQSMLSGRRAGAAAMLGNEAGVLAWGVAAALGLSALLVASQVAYEVLRLAGAGVLVWFGARALWQARRRGGDGGGAVVEDAGDAGRGSLGRSFRLGLVTAAANPKAGVFAVSFLPQFVPEGAPVLGMLLVLSLLWVAIDVLWYLCVVWLVGSARRLMGRPAVRRRLEQVSGVVLVGLGVRLAAESR